MKRIAAFVLLGLCLSFAAAAPIPFAKKKEEPKFTVVGEWSMQWGDRVNYVLTLNKDGSYHARNPNENWQGSFTYDEKTRTLSVSETSNFGQSWLHWSVQIDKDLKGKITFPGNNNTMDFGLHPANTPIVQDTDLD